MNPSGIDFWLNNLREKVLDRRPDLIDIFDTYAGEARFGRAYIEPNLQQLDAGSSILEIGAGSLILSTQLVREGFKVTALEPTGEGFSHFDQLRALVIEEAAVNGVASELLVIPAEALAIKDRFSFAFSINVMEHVGDVGIVIHRVCESLNARGSYRFTCPNYLFPYEPHFNIPTLISKSLTERVFRKKIEGSKAVLDPSGVWNSLNWISVPRVRNIARSCNLNSVTFHKQMLSKMLTRALYDSEFASRRSPVIVMLISIIVRCRLHKLSNLIPAVMQPVIDCTLVKGP
jgi:2-polyprenyl-3-methyl-5-hydroxy-6-metoxy-1,4-benzoquinol methylase